MVGKRYDVMLVNLDPTIGHEIKKTRPCLVISPDEMNKHIQTRIVAPMTTKSRMYPTRIACKFNNKLGQIVLDQIRTIDQKRMVKKLGQIDTKTQKKVSELLVEMFSY